MSWITAPEGEVTIATRCGRNGSFRFFAAVYSREAFIRIAALVMTFGLAYGALDELHQAFVFGRGARLTDVMIDGIGIALALTVISLFGGRTSKYRP